MTPRLTGSERWAVLVVLLGGLAVAALRPGARGYENHDVPRYAQMTVEMLHADTNVPLLGREAYHAAMPISGWVPVTIARLEGSVNPATARWLSALMGALTPLVVLLLVRRALSGPPAEGTPRAEPVPAPPDAGAPWLRPALLAAGIMAVNHLSVTYARMSRVDAALCFSVAGAVASVHAGARGAGGALRRLLWYTLAGALVAFGVANKGPLAGLLVALVVGPWLLYERRFRAAGEGAAAGALVSIGLSAAWLLPYLQHLGPAEAREFWDQFIGRENFDKFETGYNKEEPFYFYALRLWHNLAPWCVPLALGLWRVLRRPAAATSLERLAACWAIFPLLLFSVAAGKHDRYMLYQVPGMAILAALEIERWITVGPALARKVLERIVDAVASLAIAAGIIAPIGLGVYAQHDPYAYAIGLGVAAGGAVAARGRRRGDLDRALVGTHVVAAGVFTFLFAAVYPVDQLDVIGSAHLRLAEMLRPRLAAQDRIAVDVAYARRDDLDASLLTLYLGRWVETVDPTQSSSPPDLAPSAWPPGAPARASAPGAVTGAGAGPGADRGSPIPVTASATPGRLHVLSRRLVPGYADAGPLQWAKRKRGGTPEPLHLLVPAGATRTASFVPGAVGISPPADPGDPRFAGHEAAAERLRALAATAQVPFPLEDVTLRVAKGLRRLTLVSRGVELKSYPIALGFTPAGPKQREGDGKTPEGPLYVCTRNEKSRFHLFLGLSYPTPADGERGLAEGLVPSATAARVMAVRPPDCPPWDTPLGGEVGIHGRGGAARGDWTAGCIGLEDADMDEVWLSCPLGTRVEVVP